MRTRTKLIYAVALVAAAAGGAALFLGRDREPAARAAFRWSMSDGARLVYDLTWSSTQRVPELAAQLEGALHIAGRLELRGHGRRGDAWLVEARLAPTTGRLVVMGQDVLASPGALGDATAWAELGDDGALRAIEVAPGAPAAWQNLAGSLFAQLEVVTPSDAGATWRAVQRGAFGRGAAEYAAAGPVAVRVRAPYDEISSLPSGASGSGVALAARAQLLLGPGYLTDVLDREELTVTRADGAVRLAASSTFALHLVEVGRFATDPAVASASRRRLAPGAVISDGDGERRALIARIAGMTADDLLAGVLVLAEDGLPDPGAWAWRATGLLQLQPALCGALAEAFVAGKMGRFGRALALDLLAGAGTPEAQAAMRRALASAPAHASSEDWLRYVQRLSFLDHPVPDTVAFARALLRDAAARGEAHGERAAAFILGNFAGSLAGASEERSRPEDPEAAATAHALAAELRGALAAARTADDRAAWVTAYGAAQRPDVVDVLTPHLTDADPGVRRAVVAALGDAADVRRAEPVLLDRVTDTDAMVQGAVLGALGARAVSRDSLAALGQRLDAAHLARTNDLALAAFAAGQRQRGADLAPLAGVLGEVAARCGDPKIRALVRQALGA